MIADIALTIRIHGSLIEWIFSGICLVFALVVLFLTWRAS